MLLNAVWSENTRFSRDLRAEPATQRALWSGETGGTEAGESLKRRAVCGAGLGELRVCEMGLAGQQAPRPQRRAQMLCQEHGDVSEE